MESSLSFSRASRWISQLVCDMLSNRKRSCPRGLLVSRFLINIGSLLLSPQSEPALPPRIVVDDHRGPLYVNTGNGEVVWGVYRLFWHQSNSSFRSVGVYLHGLPSEWMHIALHATIWSPVQLSLILIASHTQCNTYEAEGHTDTKKIGLLITRGLPL